MEKIKEFLNKVKKSNWTKLVFLTVWYMIVTDIIGYNKEARLIAYTIVFAMLLYLVVEKILEEYQEKEEKAKRKYVDKRSAKEIEETAYHEAAHAVVCRIACKNAKIESITIVSDGNFGGYVKPVHKNGHIRKPDFLADLQVGMAGLVVEEILYGGHSNGCKTDIQTLKKRAYFMINELAMGKKFMYSQAESNEVDVEVAEMLNEAKEKATVIVKNNMNLIEALKDELLKKKEMNSQEVDDFFQQFGI